VSASHEIKYTASDKSGMTFDELAAFVSEARRAGATGSERLDIRTTFKGNLTSVAVAVTRPLGQPASIEPPENSGE
jgi:hypothetical protein